MTQALQRRGIQRRVLVAPMSIAALAIGVMSASAVMVADAGAATSRTTTKVVVSTVKNTKLGTILVSGKTLYTLQPSKTACTAACQKIWPELTLPKGVTKATAGTGINAAKLGSVMRSNGVRQVTYNGKALYFFSGDKSAGKVNGILTDTWGKWSVYVTVKPTGSGSGTTTSTGGVAF